MSVQIIVDSTVDMPDRIKECFRIVPLTVHFGGEEFIDGVTIDKARFYERLVESDVLPTTSQATPAAFQKVFEEVTAAGDSAVVITISSKLSGTYQSACIAAADFDNIFVVDSMTAAIGSGILAEHALKLAEAGISSAQIAEELEEKKADVCLIALLTVQNGEVVVIGKARGSKQGNNLLVEKIHRSGGIDFSMPILLGYSGLSDLVLKKYVEDSRVLWQDGTDALDSTLLCGVIGTHTGPGVVAVAFFTKSSAR